MLLSASTGLSLIVIRAGPREAGPTAQTFPVSRENFDFDPEIGSDVWQKSLLINHLYVGLASIPDCPAGSFWRTDRRQRGHLAGLPLTAYASLVAPCSSPLAALLHP